MKLAVLSDIHGNLTALEAVLADLEQRPADRMICLGDAIQGGAQPAECVARLRELGCPVVMGNADAWLLSGVSTGAEVVSAERRAILEDVRQWSLTKLGPADRDFIAAFPATVTVNLGSHSLLGFHGSPASFDEILLPTTPQADFERMLDEHQSHLLCGGHVHLQFQRRLNETLHFNPGSIGLAYQHGLPDDAPLVDPWAEYAVLEVDSRCIAIEFRRVPYKVTAYMRVLRSSGRPHADITIRQFRRIS